MSIRRLEKELSEATNTFNEEIVFMLETFYQSHSDEYLTKQDMEDISRQVFYAMNSFNKSIIKYLRNQDR